MSTGNAVIANTINNLFGSLILPVFLAVGLVLIVNPDRLISRPTQIMLAVSILNAVSNTLYAFEPWAGICPYAKVAIINSGIYDTARHYYVYQRTRAMCNGNRAQELTLLVFFIIFFISELAFVGEGLLWCVIKFEGGTYIQITWGICSALFQFVAAVFVWQSSKSFSAMNTNSSSPTASIVMYFKYIAQLYMGLFLIMELPIQILVPVFQNFLSISINPVLNIYIEFQTILLLAESLSISQAAERAQSKAAKTTSGGNTRTAKSMNSYPSKIETVNNMSGGDLVGSKSTLDKP